MRILAYYNIYAEMLMYMMRCCIRVCERHRFFHDFASLLPYEVKRETLIFFGSQSMYSLSMSVSMILKVPIPMKKPLPRY